MKKRTLQIHFWNFMMKCWHWSLKFPAFSSNPPRSVPLEFILLFFLLPQLFVTIFYPTPFFVNLLFNLSRCFLDFKLHRQSLKLKIVNLFFALFSSSLSFSLWLNFLPLSRLLEFISYHLISLRVFLLFSKSLLFFITLAQYYFFHTSQVQLLLSKIIYIAEQYQIYNWFLFLNLSSENSLVLYCFLPSPWKLIAFYSTHLS